MILYKKKAVSIIKFIIAIVIFIAAMTITFDEVVGSSSKNSSPVIDHSISNVE